MSSTKFDGPSPYAQSQWERWEMQPFELPTLDHNLVDPTPEPEEALPDAASILAEVQRAKQAAIKKGYDEGYAKGHAEGVKKGTTEGHAQGLKTGLSEGHEKGLREGHAEGAVQAQHEAERLAQLVSASQSTLERLNEDMGQAMLTLAVRVACHVLQTTLEEQPERILDLIQQLLHVDPDGKNPLTLFLNPVDHQLVSNYLKDNENTQHWRIIEDANISAGGCKARTALGDIDATLETRWRRAISSLALGTDLSHLHLDLDNQAEAP